MNILLILMTVFLVAFFGWAALNPSWLYRFPILWAASFAGFALPQLIGLGNETSALAMNLMPPGALDLLTLMSILCLFAVLLGDIRGANHPGTAPIRAVSSYDPSRLIFVATVLTYTGIVIYHVGISMIDQEQLKHNRLSGPVTILGFFQVMQRYGLALSLICYFRWRSVLGLMNVLFYVVFRTYGFFATASRGETADMAFIVLLGLYFGRRIIVPAWMMGLMFAFGAIWSNCIDAFRGEADISYLEKIEQADVFSRFQDTLGNGGYELLNAAMICSGCEHVGGFDYGTSHYNAFVHAYFPGQIFGFDLKRSLMLDNVQDWGQVVWGYHGPVGATWTGMTDAFCSFWYFGCLKYYVIGYMMGRWWNRANRGDLWSQLAYMSLMVTAMHTVSHTTHGMLTGYVHMWLFSYFPVWWARLPVTTVTENGVRMGTGVPT